MAATTVTVSEAPQRPEIELQEAAAVLGVHYQTAYKWVRSGVLPAQIVKGRYRIDESVVHELALRREQPRRLRCTSARRLGRVADRVLRLLRDGEEQAVRELISELRNGGVALGHR